MTSPVEPPSWSAVSGYQCFGCAPGNPAGLQLRGALFPEDGSYRASFVPAAQFESYPGIVHGGIVAATLDECMGNLIATAERRVCFTTSMRVTYMAPLRIGERYELRARFIAGPASPLRRTEAEVLDASGEVIATATASYRPIQHAQARALLKLSESELEAYDGFFEHPEPR